MEEKKFANIHQHEYNMGIIFSHIFSIQIIISSHSIPPPLSSASTFRKCRTHELCQNVPESVLAGMNYAL